MKMEPQSGWAADKTHHLPIRIYYEDTDFSGVVYHAAYLKFMERGRTEALRASGTVHTDLLNLCPPLAFAVRRMDISFLAPAKIDDATEVQTKFLSAKGARIHVAQSIFCEERELVQAQIELACIDLHGAPKRLPKTLLADFSPLLFGKLT